MAEDDIYGSKHKYERFKAKLKELATPPVSDGGVRGMRKYYCRNPTNLKYFQRLFLHFEARDISYIRRHRLLQSMRLVCHLTQKDLGRCTRDDVDEIVRAMHEIYRTPKSKQTFIGDIKYFWRILFPEKDGKGRPDESLIPYPVRHLSARMDRSREKRRRDKVTVEEFERLLAYFSSDPRVQAYLSVALESLARPQELLYRRIEDVELRDHYARICISEHGKEGVGLLQCIDSYPYLARWLEIHPLKRDPRAFLFINTGDTNRGRQMKPANVNKLIRKACKDLGIDKPITCYSLKRNGVTMRRLRGDSDMEIQHAARWTSTKQLKTYDLSSQEEAFTRELEKRGLVPVSNGNALQAKRCDFCGESSGSTDVLCQNCKRPLDRAAIREEAQQHNREMEQLRADVATLTSELAKIRQEVVAALAEEILTREPMVLEGMVSKKMRRRVYEWKG